jgi:hypothetical protein
MKVSTVHHLDDYFQLYIESVAKWTETTLWNPAKYRSFRLHQSIALCSEYLSLTPRLFLLGGVFLDVLTGMDSIGEDAVLHSKTPDRQKQQAGEPTTEVQF